MNYMVLNHEILCEFFNYCGTSSTPELLCSENTASGCSAWLRDVPHNNSIILFLWLWEAKNWNRHWTPIILVHPYNSRRRYFILFLIYSVPVRPGPRRHRQSTFSYTHTQNLHAQTATDCTITGAVWMKIGRQQKNKRKKTTMSRERGKLSTTTSTIKARYCGYNNAVRPGFKTDKITLIIKSSQCNAERDTDKLGHSLISSGMDACNCVCTGSQLTVRQSDSCSAAHRSWNST